jgi:hypothetical protein
VAAFDGAACGRACRREDDESSDEGEHGRRDGQWGKWSVEMYAQAGEDEMAVPDARCVQGQVGGLGVEVTDGA